MSGAGRQLRAQRRSGREARPQDAGRSGGEQGRCGVAPTKVRTPAQGRSEEWERRSLAEEKAEKERSETPPRRSYESEERSLA